jgi:hypothetical protein
MLYVFAEFITYVSTLFLSMLNLTVTHNLKSIPCRNSLHLPVWFLKGLVAKVSTDKHTKFSIPRRNK